MSSGATIVALLSLAPPSTGEQPSLFFQFLPFILIFGVFYFLVFAPMRKKQKVHADMLRELKPGQRVVTSGGIHGTVVSVTDEVVQLRIADQVKIDLTKSAVSAVQQQAERQGG
jgi:preprotein translocase subunit YajC